jgi:hypothetical protein
MNKYTKISLVLSVLFTLTFFAGHEIGTRTAYVEPIIISPAPISYSVDYLEVIVNNMPESPIKSNLYLILSLHFFGRDHELNTLLLNYAKFVANPRNGA